MIYRNKRTGWFVSPWLVYKDDEGYFTSVDMKSVPVIPCPECSIRDAKGRYVKQLEGSNILISKGRLYKPDGQDVVFTAYNPCEPVAPVFGELPTTYPGEFTKQFSRVPVPLTWWQKVIDRVLRLFGYTIEESTLSWK